MDGQRVAAGSRSGRSQRGSRPGARPFGKGWDQGNFRPLVRPRGTPRGGRVQVWARKGDPCLGSPPPQLFHPSLNVRLPEVSELPEEQRAEALLSWPWWAGSPSTHPQGGPARSLANSQPHVLCGRTAARVLGGLSLPSGAMGGAEPWEELGPRACARRGSCRQGPSSAADAAWERSGSGCERSRRLTRSRACALPPGG